MTPVLLSLALSLGQPAEEPKKFESPVGAFAFRSLGPAVTSGRVSALAVNPKDRSHYYVAVASGGVWKTTNAGTTWTPIFDGEGSYSIGAVTIDPHDSNIVWVGTGENNSQRSVGFGDGVYKSADGGRTWANMGLKQSEHIAKIMVHPRRPEVVFVASQGPLWGPGGDRGLYRSNDSGKKWDKILSIDDNTGVTDFVIDPLNPDIIVAASYQRRRHVYTLVNGGPGSALHRSTDGGLTWNKVTKGLPSVELGRIGLAQSPSDPNTIYAQVEATEKNGGLFRSTDNGKTWEKRNPFDSQAQYFCNPVVDPLNKDRLYIMHVVNQVSDDGGKTLKPLGEANKHVDNHAFWIDPSDPKYYLCGCDGGVYESFDSAATWHFKSNLPVTQFYDIAVDQNPASGPFYHVYGGTQDNFTLGGPARTRSRNGITNADWYVVQGGDGFHCKVDPSDPNTVYGESQYAGLCRFDRRTGNRVAIQPMAKPGEPPLRWNWDSPLAVSSHNSKRLYFAANKVFRSDDRGDSWIAISGDLTRNLNRDTLPVYGKILPPEAVAKHLSTSFYGNIVAIAECPKNEGTLYVGTDDGLIQITNDGGKTWAKQEKFPGVAEGSYVSKLVAGQHGDATVFAAFDNHKNADFKPYLLKSIDGGKTWNSIVGDLPVRGGVFAIVEDHVNPDLLFCGTEFGLYVTYDSGKHWQRMKNGLPTIQVKDLVIQKHNNDLVVGTFGRGIYILDDYSPMRKLSPEAVKETKSWLVAPDQVYAYVPMSQLGGNGKSFQGASFYIAPNPAFGATFTLHLQAPPKTLKQKRKDAEKEATKAGMPIPYPTPEQLRAEAEEEPATVELVILDSEKNHLARVNCPTAAGLHRVTWNLREQSVGGDFLVTPGRYLAQVVQHFGGVKTILVEAMEFSVKSDPLSTLKSDDYTAIAAFHKEVKAAQKQLHTARNLLDELFEKIEKMRAANKLAPTPDDTVETKSKLLADALRIVKRDLLGDAVLAARYENLPMSTSERLSHANAGSESIALPTGTAKQALADAKKELVEALVKIKDAATNQLPPLEKRLDEIGAPWTPGRLK